MQNAVFNRDTRRCETAKINGVNMCSTEMLAMKVRYQSSPIDHTKFGNELQPLSCRNDQQYLAEHDKYCNLYHSCILGKYQMYACVTLGSFDKTSYFYYTNGDCAAPNPSQCGPNKSIYPYEKLFVNDNFQVYNSNAQVSPTQPERTPEPLRAIRRHVAQQPPPSPPVQIFTGQARYKTLQLQAKPELFNPTLVCNQDQNLDLTREQRRLVAHPIYCNVFTECVGNGKQNLYACIDAVTGLFSGIFEEQIQNCKPFSKHSCPSNSIYNPVQDSTMRDMLNKPDNSTDRSLTNYQASQSPLILPSLFQPPQPQKVSLLSENFQTESAFTCDGKPSGYYESEWCNVFFRCVDGKRIDTRCSGTGDSNHYDLWWEHQNVSYDALNPVVFLGPDEEAKCEWPCRVKCDKKVWLATGKYVDSSVILTKDKDMHFDCSQQNNLNRINYMNDLNKNLAASNAMLAAQNDQKLLEESLQQQQDQQQQQQQTSAFETQVIQIENANPSVFFCELDGLFKDPIYCNFFHVCMGSERKTYQCKMTSNESLIAVYDPAKMACVLKENLQEMQSICKGIIYDASVMSVPNFQDSSSESSSDGSKQQQPVLADGQQQQQQPPLGSYMAQLVSGMIDPAPGYISLPSSQFQTSFKCPQELPGYYPNDEYCDVFHYCYANGQFKTYTCASMQNQYQLWWSHQTEPGRRDVSQ
jgi:hypothetical protein